MIIRELITKLGFKVDTATLSAFDKRIGETKRRITSMTQNIEGMARGMRNTGLVLTAAVSLPVALLGIKALKTASDLEQMDVAFTTMLGSAEKSKALIKDLLEFTAKTPFQIKDVQQNAKLLLGMGIEAEKIIPTMNALGNVSAGLSVPLERIAMNYGQVRTQTKLAGTELRDFARAGIPIIQQLSKQLGVSEIDVKSMVSAGKISFKDVEKAFMDMAGEGGKFFNLMQKQSKTLGGRWSNLMDIMTIMSAEFGIMIEETFNLKENLRKLTVVFERFTTKLKTMSPFWRKFIVGLGTAAIILPILITLFGAIALAIISIYHASLLLAPVFLKLGAIGFAGFGIILAKILLVIAAIAAIGFILWSVYDDIRTWVKGGDSLIGILLGSFERFSARVRLLWSLLKLTFSSLWEALSTGSDKAWEKFKKNLSLLSAHIAKVIEDMWAKLTKTDEKLNEIQERIGKALLKLGWAIVKGVFAVLKNSIKFLFMEIGDLISGWLETFTQTINTKMLNKFPRLSKFLGLDETTGTNQAGKNIPITTLPPGALANAGMSGGNNQSININSKVELTLPEGTPEQQEKHLQVTADAIFNKKLNDLVGMTLDANPQVEQ